MLKLNKLCFYMFWCIWHLCENVLSTTTSPQFNITEANKRCEHNGGLLPYGVFTGAKSSVYLSSSVLNNIPDGDSAWVSGSVHYSNLLSWKGCYLDVKGFEIKTEDSLKGESVLFMCLNLCNNVKDVHYIGIKKGSCQCVTKTGLKGNDRIPNSKCAFIMPGSAYGINFSMLNSNDYGMNIHVYEIHSHEKLSWEPPFKVSFGQCVFVEKTSNETNKSTIRYHTGSCFSKIVENGLICVDADGSAHDGNCTYSGTDSTTVYCVRNNSSNWLQANQECYHLNGKGVGIISDDMARMMRPNVTYWTGLFRDFQLNPSTTIGSDTVCISVRKYDNGFFFDPSDCSELKHALCEKFFEQEIKDNVQPSESRSDLGKNINCSCGTTLVIVSLTFNMFNGILLVVIIIGATYVYSRRRIKTGSRHIVISGRGPETGTHSVNRIEAGV
jgi:hypothetical protein